MKYQSISSNSFCFTVIVKKFRKRGRWIAHVLHRRKGQLLFRHSLQGFSRTHGLKISYHVVVSFFLVFRNGSRGGGQGLVPRTPDSSFEAISFLFLYLLKNVRYSGAGLNCKHPDLRVLRYLWYRVVATDLVYDQFCIRKYSVEYVFSLPLIFDVLSQNWLQAPSLLYELRYLLRVW